MTHIEQEKSNNIRLYHKQNKFKYKHLNHHFDAHIKRKIISIFVINMFLFMFI